MMGVLFTLAIPSLTSTVESFKLKADARKMAQCLRMARQDAITTGYTTKFIFYANSDRYKGYYSSPALPVSYRLNKGNMIVGVPNFTQKIDKNPACAFYPSGAPSSGGTVTLKNSNNKKLYVIVNPVAGRVRISDKPPENWD